LIEELMHIHPCKATKVNARFACIWFHWTCHDILLVLGGNQNVDHIRLSSSSSSSFYPEASFLIHTNDGVRTLVSIQLKLLCHYIFWNLCLCLSLSLSLYIYIYIYLSSRIRTSLIWFGFHSMKLKAFKVRNDKNSS
jgi:hypothetical protein